MEPQTHETLRLLGLLLFRLERISVDSRWAHRASGLRGNLLRAIENLESGNPLPEGSLSLLMERGFFILKQAARERKS